MLVDINYRELEPEFLYRALGGGAPVRLGKGLYEAGLNWNGELKANGLLKDEYPF